MRYIINSNPTTGSATQVVAHLDEYMRKCHNALVDEAQIVLLVDALKSAQYAYIAEHKRCKAVNIYFNRTEWSSWICIGNRTYTLTAIDEDAIAYLKEFTKWS